MNIGDKVWVVQLDDAGLYCAMPGKIHDARDGPRGTNYYVEMWRKDREGKKSKMIADRQADRVFGSEREALLSAAARNAEAADRHTLARIRQMEKMARLSRKD